VRDRRRRGNYTKPSPKRWGKQTRKRVRTAQEKHQLYKRPAGALEYDAEEIEDA
jgi:hypothetical protein